MICRNIDCCFERTALWHVASYTNIITHNKSCTPPTSGRSRNSLHKLEVKLLLLQTKGVFKVRYEANHENVACFNAINQLHYHFYLEVACKPTYTLMAKRQCCMFV
jgi:hypothetical protein